MILALMSSVGALSFVIGVALLALDTARSLDIGRFDATTFQTLWVNLGLEETVPLHFYLTQGLGSAADSILELPAAFVAFGLGMALLILFDGAQRHRSPKSLIF